MILNTAFNKSLMQWRFSGAAHSSIALQMKSWAISSEQNLHITSLTSGAPTSPSKINTYPNSNLAGLFSIGSV
jgi:hypothetical protein